MTIFNPKQKDVLTFGEILEPAMGITDEREAAQYKIDYIAHTEKNIKNGLGDSGLTAEQVVNSNLGYYAGYYGDEVRKRVERLFNCSHPIFGSVEKNGIPTNQEAFECGRSSKTLDEVRISTPAPQTTKEP